uniref:RNA-binding protein 28 n=1 Tax=Phallusia mammillata TaxID=59560 RepID=A0A6F9DRE5_9ASCI|nr:RNA-binding protein 28 [Phallusia mammillata]
MEGTVSHTTVFVQGIPAACSNDQLNEIFSVVGPIKKCFVIKKKDSAENDSEKLRYVGLVSYQTVDDARKAVNSPPDKFEVNGSALKVCFARKKKFSKAALKKEKQNTTSSDFEVVKNKAEDRPEDSNTTDKNSTKPKSGSKSDTLSKCTVAVSGLPSTFTKSKLKEVFKKKNLGSVLDVSLHSKEPKVFHVSMANKQSALKAIFQLTGKVIDNCTIKAVLVVDTTSKDFRKSSKRSRLIIRNLSFNCSEEELKSAFEVYGEITDVQIPTKPNGKKLGFGFIQYTHVFEAQKAIEELNKTEISGRKIAVDWALPREKYKQMKGQQEPQKSDDSAMDNNDTDVDESAEIDAEGSSDEDGDVDSEEDSGLDSEGEVDESGTEEHDQEEEDSEMSDDPDDSDEDSDDHNDLKEDKNYKKQLTKAAEDTKKAKQKSKDYSSDVHEGKTVFIRNLSFDTQEEDLEEEMGKLGDIKYCKVVINQANGLSKGCAFIQYLNLEAAENCISTLNNEASKLVLDGRELFATVAMSRPDARKHVKVQHEEKNEKDDKRNLYLANEGLIRPGTQPAMGLSEIELNKRRKIDEAKRMKLKNPNIFVSTTRICVHNIPRAYDDNKIREVFLKAVKGAKITEARIMRDRNTVNSDGVARSLGFGFINFTKHEHALAALREVNNNPKVFGATKRPIVEFSLENKLALATQRQRRKRQLAKNDLQRRMRPAAGSEKGETPASKRQKRWERKRERREKEKGSEGGERKRKKAQEGDVAPQEKKPYQGSTGTTSSGKKLRMPKHTGPKIRKRNKGQVLEQLRISKKLNKQARAPPGVEKKKRQPAPVKTDVTKPAGRRHNGKMSQDLREDKEFNSLVAKYTNKFKSGVSGNSKPKWFET